jgi:hypothetical protein
MKASAIKKAITTMAKTGRPIMIWGSYGLGKSTVARQWVKENKRQLFEMTTTALEPIDLRGLCSIKNGKTIWNPPAFLPDKPGCVLLIEDLTNGHPQVLTALYALILDGRLGDYILPKDTIIIANGNRETDASYATKMPMALATRFVHINFEFDLNDFINNAIDNQFDMSTICFGRAFPKLINVPDPKGKEKAQPVPRTWEFVSDIMRTEPDLDIRFELIAGTVGEGAAMEFCAFLEVFNELPDITATLKNPSTLKELPTKPSVMYAFIGAMSRRVDDKTMKNLLIVADRMIKEGFAEFAITMVNDATRYNPKLKETKDYIAWISKNQDFYK